MLSIVSGRDRMSWCDQQLNKVTLMLAQLSTVSEVICSLTFLNSTSWYGFQALHNNGIISSDRYYQDITTLTKKISVRFELESHGRKVNLLFTRTFVHRYWKNWQSGRLCKLVNDFNGQITVSILIHIFKDK